MEGEVQVDLAGADDDQMLRQALAVAQLDAGHRAARGEPGHVRNGRVRAQVQEHTLAAHPVAAAIPQLDLDRARAAPRP